MLPLDEAVVVVEVVEVVVEVVVELPVQGLVVQTASPAWLQTQVFPHSPEKLVPGKKN